jgi:hypothetical protein
MARGKRCSDNVLSLVIVMRANHKAFRVVQATEEYSARDGMNLHTR